MWLRLYASTLTLLLVPLIAQADDINQGFTANGTALQNKTGTYGVTSSTFSEFDPSLGTLNSIEIQVEGEASSNGEAAFVYITPVNDPQLASVGGYSTQPDPTSVQFGADEHISLITLGGFRGAQERRRSSWISIAQ